MATKLYLRKTAETVAITPAADSAWEDSASMLRAYCRTTSGADTIGNVTVTETTSTDKDCCAFQYQAPLKAGQVIHQSQAVQFVAQFQESTSSNNMNSVFGIRVIASNGSTVRKTVLVVTREANEVVASPTAATNRNNTATSAATGDYTTVDGDFLVIEIGAGGDPTSTNPHTYTIRLGDSSATFLTANDTGTSATDPNSAWVQLNDTLTLEPSMTTSLIGPGNALNVPTVVPGDVSLSGAVISATAISVPTAAYEITNAFLTITDALYEPTVEGTAGGDQSIAGAFISATNINAPTAAYAMTLPTIGVIALVAHTAKEANPDIVSIDTNAMDTSIADTIFIGVCEADGTTGTPSCNYTNTWDHLTTYKNGTVQFTIYYAKNAAVGTGHTFHLGSSLVPSMAVAAFSGLNLASPFDVENGGATSAQPGSILPRAVNELIVTGVAIGNNVSITSIDSGFAISDTVPFTAGNNYGTGLAYKIKQDVDAENPTWSFSGAVNDALAIAGFKSRVGSTLYSPNVIQSLTNGFISSGNTIYSPTVAPGPVTLIGIDISSTVVYVPEVDQGGAQAVTGAFIGSANVLDAPSVAYEVRPPNLGSIAALYSPTITVGAVDLINAFIASVVILYAPRTGDVSWPGMVLQADISIQRSYSGNGSIVTNNQASISLALSSADVSIFRSQHAEIEV